jgi:hypothetical protein
MRRNLAGLQHSAQFRSNAALEKAQNAIRRMQTEEQPIDFRTVAAVSGVSTAWLYKTKPMREYIMKLRAGSSKPVAENSGIDRRLVSQERVIATLRHRIKEVEAKNKELKEQLELAYGQLAARPSNDKSARRGHVHDVQDRNNTKKSLDDYR